MSSTKPVELRLQWYCKSYSEKRIYQYYRGQEDLVSLITFPLLTIIACNQKIWSVFCKTNNFRDPDPQKGPSYWWPKCTLKVQRGEPGLTGTFQTVGDNLGYANQPKITPFLNQLESFFSCCNNDSCFSCLWRHSSLFIGPRCPWGPIYGSGCL